MDSNVFWTLWYRSVRLCTQKSCNVPLVFQRGVSYYLVKRYIKGLMHKKQTIAQEIDDRMSYLLEPLQLFLSLKEVSGHQIKNSQMTQGGGSHTLQCHIDHGQALSTSCTIYKKKWTESNCTLLYMAPSIRNHQNLFKLPESMTLI